MDLLKVWHAHGRIKMSEIPIDLLKVLHANGLIKRYYYWQIVCSPGMLYSYKLLSCQPQKLVLILLLMFILEYLL